MNERIKELAEQAKAQYCDLSDASCFKRLGLVEAVVFKPEELKKFAELIVVECAMFVVTELEGKVGSAIADATANRLEEHFGVEE